MGQIRSILENMKAVAVEEALSEAQQARLSEDVVRAMLDDATIDPRTKGFIEQGLQQGFSGYQLNGIYSELSGELKKIDPTPQHTYVNFMLRMYAKGGVEFGTYVNQDFTDLLTTYDSLKKRNKIKPPFNDMNQFQSLQEFIDFTKSTGEVVASQSEVGRVDKVYEDDKVTIVVPLDEAASCTYGRGTKWCVSGRAANQFDIYNGRGKLYFLIPKEPEYPEEKYAIHFVNGIFMDDHDAPSGSGWVLTRRFGDLVEKYFKDNPDYLAWQAREERGA